MQEALGSYRSRFAFPAKMCEKISFDLLPVSLHFSSTHSSYPWPTRFSPGFPDCFPGALSLVSPPVAAQRGII